MGIMTLLFIPFAISLGCFAMVIGKNTKICTALHIMGLALTAFMSLKIGADVLSQGSLMGVGQWFYVDSLSAIFVGLIGIVGLLVGLYSVGYIKTELQQGELTESRYAQYYGFFHLFVFTMLLSVTTNNIVVMWIGIEATTLSSAFLVGMYNKRSSLEAAWKYIMICSVGVAFGLYGTLLTFSDANNVLNNPELAIFWTEISKNATALDPTLMYIAFAFILIGFGTKCGLFPMHTWLPDAHSEAPSPVSAMLSAILLNCAMLVVIRYYIILNKLVGVSFAQNLLLVFGVVSVALAALFILVQSDLKRLLAYSSIENMGLISVGLGLGGPLGVFAALLHTINHSLAKALLFCASGNILLKYHSRDITQVQGLWKVAPITAVLFAGGALALGGIPPFNIFVSEFMLITAGISVGKTGLMVICLLLLTLVLAGLTKAVLKTVLGAKPDAIEVGEGETISLVAMSILLGLMLLMGICIADPLLTLLHNAVGIILNQEGQSFREMLLLPWQQLSN